MKNRRRQKGGEPKRKKKLGKMPRRYRTVGRKGKNRAAGRAPEHRLRLIRSPLAGSRRMFSGAYEAPRKRACAPRECLDEKRAPARCNCSAGLRRCIWRGGVGGFASRRGLKAVCERETLFNGEGETEERAYRVYGRRAERRRGREKFGGRRQAWRDG